MEDNIKKGNEKARPIIEEMQESFINYAMAVNVSRAIPDVRDGLKPVHRRILYDMAELNLFNDKPYRKCARIVGDVLGKFHPHGDSAVYDALVRLAQDFSIRCPLVDGHGNFGSVDGDGAAAMRYTEARLSKVAGEMLRDLEKDSVDFYPNFDGTLMQPTVLPSRFPNLLVNGADGIAVGMATNIPPHNLGEAIDCVVAMIDNPEITIDELISIMPAPDFPTGGIIMGRNAIRQAYKTGRGGIVVRAKAEIEEENGRSHIIVTELPYQVNKAKLIMQIADLVKSKRIDGISDIKEESDRTGMRIVIDIKKDANAQVVFNLLYKHSNLQVSDGIIMLALVGKEPKILNLQEIIFHYLNHQREIILRRTKFELNKAQEKEHIIEGLVIALNDIDRVIAIIKGSADKVEAGEKLREEFFLSEKQTTAILEMRLQRLTSLEVEKLRKELQDLKALIAELKSIIESPQKIDAIVRKEILEIKDKYNTPRRTQISIDYGDIDIEDLIPKEDVVISLTHAGYIKRLAVSEYKSQNRGGVGVIGHKPKEEDFVEHLFITNSHDHLLCFSNFGRVYSLRAYEVPEAQKTAKGRAMVNLLNLSPNEKISTIIPVNDRTNGFLTMATKNGLIKRTPMTAFERINKNGKFAINLLQGDELIGVALTDGNQEIILSSSNGRTIHFKETQVRVMGRTAKGVRGMKLIGDAKVVDMTIVQEDDFVIVVSELGIGKRMKASEIRLTKRGGKGVKAGRFNTKTGKLVCLKKVTSENDIMLVSVNGTVIRVHADAIGVFSRMTYGVKIMNIRGENVVVSVGIAEREEENDNQQNQDLVLEEVDENDNLKDFTNDDEGGEDDGSDEEIDEEIEDDDTADEENHDQTKEFNDFLNKSLSVDDLNLDLDDDEDDLDEEDEDFDD